MIFHTTLSISIKAGPFIGTSVTSIFLVRSTVNKCGTPSTLNITYRRLFFESNAVLLISVSYQSRSLIGAKAERERERERERDR